MGKPLYALAQAVSQALCVAWCFVSGHAFGAWFDNYDGSYCRYCGGCGRVEVRTYMQMLKNRRRPIWPGDSGE